MGVSEEANELLRTITVLPVHDIAEAAQWYGWALGFETVYLHTGDDVDEATNYAILRRDALDVHLILDEPPPHRRPWTKAGTGYLYLLVKNVDRLLEEVQSRGVSIARGLQLESWGARGFDLTDPSANTIHIEQLR